MRASLLLAFSPCIESLIVPSRSVRVQPILPPNVYTGPSGLTWFGSRWRFCGGEEEALSRGAGWLTWFRDVDVRGRRRGAARICWSKGFRGRGGQAWWSRPAKAVVQRLWRPPGTTGAACAVCARMQMHLADTYPHVSATLRRESGDGVSSGCGCWFAWRHVTGAPFVRLG